MTKLTPAIALAAIAGYAQQINELNLYLAEIQGTSKTSSLVAASGGTQSPGNVAPREERPAGKRKMSAAGKAAIAAAQKRRWAKQKAQEKPTPIAEVAKPRKKFSKATLKKMAAAQKARWANKDKAMGATA
jgi:hypothetical protein